MNIIMCVPLVFLVPLIWKGYRRTGRTVLLGAGFSLLIELSQMITARAADIDDLIANTSGAFLGYIAWKIFTLLFGVHLKQGGR
ncbi:MAG TPA: VanZ family protein [Candidatus Eisenbergiella merdipullorum]|uniref:VanZ family protein n=1 Tax=Candidatus Eisenbergiella merdipullorum TaxID=2838553 RepID=A0A9D2I4U1_9FIRM|nr:VanZ family protein [Candidatus Eisenbergiella merdipullorum]